uniref:Uncharacterized protein n=1 Tax=Papilio xuthus TaxID=66420 RepID=I4DP39_PAPXU|nr:unknown unsecreted protein [Papilio xuthus]
MTALAPSCQCLKSVNRSFSYCSCHVVFFSFMPFLWPCRFYIFSDRTSRDSSAFYRTRYRCLTINANSLVQSTIYYFKII